MSLIIDGSTNTITAASGVAITGAVNFPAGSVGAPAITLSTDTTTGIYRVGANNDGYAVSGAKVLDISSTGLAVTGNLSLGTANGDDYIIKPGSQTNTGMLMIQAGSGSAGYGGGLTLFSHSHATYPGDCVAGISLNSGGRFRVNSTGVRGTGTDWLVSSSTGLAVTGTVNIVGTAASTTGGQLNLGSTTQTTIGANGAATALTANPLGYLVAYVGTTKVIIPYYNA